MTSADLYTHRYGVPGTRPVMALHGIQAHGARWRRLAERYLPGVYVVAPDLRGHGRSTWEPPWSVERHVMDLLAVMDQLELAQVDVVGHSFGGLIGIHLSRTAPERVRRLALLDPSVGLAPAGLHDLARRTMQAPSFADREQARAEREARWPFASPGAVADEVAEHLEAAPDGRWRWRFNPAAVVTACSEMALPAVLPPSTVPTLLAIARRSGFVRPEFVAACRSSLGDALAVAELDSDHMLYLERPDEVGTLLHRFFAADAAQA
ncbi:alpha/beta fold hydrolase [Streptomyces griseorubiginosus]|uniref:alpha/beta fold hydrolase n=1 Tax=Streptomyces griseorubiginosus TaxID=67304 RepID=UPI0036F064C7